MRNFKIALLLSAAIAIGAPPVMASTSAQEKQRYEAFFTRELSDGYVLYSEKKRMRVTRERRGDQAVTMYDELDTAAGVQLPTESVGADVRNPDDQFIDFAYRYDYSNKRMHGPERFTEYFNKFIRPLMIKHGTGPGRSSARFTVSFAQMGLPDVDGQAATVVVRKQYVDFDGRRFALINFEVPAFSYSSDRGESVVHWACGAAITDARGGVTYYLAVRNRAAVGASKGSGRPMYVEQASYATDQEGRALLDLRRFSEGKAHIDAALKGETGRPTHHLNVPGEGQVVAVLDRAFFSTATALTSIGLSVAEGSPNAPGGTAAAGTGGNATQVNIGGQPVNIPRRPGASAPPTPTPPAPPAPTVPRSLPGPGEPGTLGPVPAPAPRPTQTRALPGPGEPGTRGPLPAPEPRPTQTRALPGPRAPGPLEPGYTPPPPAPPPSPSPNADPVGRGPIQGDTRATYGEPAGQPAPRPSGRTLPLPGPQDATPPPPQPQPSGRTLPLPETPSPPKAPSPGAVSKVKGALKGLANTKAGRAAGRLLLLKTLADGGKEGVRLLGLDPMKGTAENLAKLDQEYPEWSQDTAVRRAFGILLSSPNPVTALKSVNDILEAGAGKNEGLRQAREAAQALMETESRRAEQLRKSIRSGIGGLQDDLARVTRKLASLEGDLAMLDEMARQAAARSRDRVRADRAQQQAGGQETEEIEQPRQPGGPGYPQMTKEQREEISRRAKEKNARQRADQDFGEIGDLGDAFAGTVTGDVIGADGGDYDWSDLEGDEITSEMLSIQMTELMLAAEARRAKERAAWDKMKANHPELTDLFGDFIENNMFDFGGLTGRGLSGTVATDLSPYGEWLLGQDIDRLNALARAAGYPNLAAALADSRNLLKKAQDTKFRQWAWEPPAVSGAIGIGFSEAQHELARAQVLLGDLLNDSRFIESTAGLTNLAISGTTLSSIFRDFGLEDGDVIEITISQYGRALLRQTLTLTNAGTAIDANLRLGVGVVEITALNEGFASPNTAEISVNNVTSGDAVQSYSLQTGETAVLRIQTGK